MHAPSLTALLVILAIVVLIFGTKKLRNMGADLGAAIRNFRTSMKEGEKEGDKPGSGDGNATPGPKTEPPDPPRP